MNKENISVKSILRVIWVKNGYKPGKMMNYSVENGLESHEIIYRLSGEVQTSFDGTVLKHKKGGLQYLPKGSGREYFVKTIETGECVDIFFDTDIPLFEEACVVEVSPELYASFMEICKLWFNKSEGYYYKAMSVLYSILAQLDSASSLKENAAPHAKKIRAAVQYLDEHFCDSDISYERLAELSEMSYSYFRRLFERHMGMPLAKYVTRKRIEYARELIASERYRISEVAELVGFSDIYYFSRVFKKETGRSPRAFAKNGQAE